MVKFFIQLVKGKQFVVDPRVGSFYLLRYGLTFLLNLTRGLIFSRRLIFRDSGVKIKESRLCNVGKWTRVQERVYIDALSQNGVVIGSNVSIGPYTRIECTGTIKKLGIGCSIGNGSGIGAFSFIGAAGGVEIGENVIMGQRISFHSENHIFEDINKPIKAQGVTSKGIVIKDDCWVGAGVIFLDGVVLGKGSVVAAGSVVNKSFPEYSVIAGVPAKIIKHRA